MEVKDYALSSYDKALLVHTVLNNPYIPVSLYDKQLKALALASHNQKGINDTLNGGGGGGGKTTLEAAAAAQFLQVPTYRCLVARKNYKELIGTGSVFDNLKSWVTPVNFPKCKINHSSPIKITSPSGAEIHFKAFPDERFKQTVKGEQYHRIIIDESSEINPEILAFMYRSLRKKVTDVLPLTMMHASNPLGPSNQYLIDNYVSEDAPNPYMRFTFEDNPHIDTDLYTESLMKLPNIDREAQLRGNWFYKPSFGLLIDGVDFDNHILQSMQGKTLLNLVSMDPASEGDDTTALTSLNYNDNNNVYLSDSLTIQDSKIESLVLEFIQRQVEKYNTFMFIKEDEPGSDSTYSSRYWEELITNEFPFVSFETSRPSISKFERSRISAKYIRQDRLWFIEDENTERLRNEFLYIMPDTKKMKKEYPSPDMLDSLNQGLNKMHELTLSSHSTVTTAKAY